jgi:hypothetical protein
MRPDQTAIRSYLRSWTRERLLPLAGGVTRACRSFAAQTKDSLLARSFAGHEQLKSKRLT